VAAECRCDDRETIAEKQRRWIIQSSHRYRNIESSGRVSGGIHKLCIQYYYESTISFHPQSIGTQCMVHRLVELSYSSPATLALQHMDPHTASFCWHGASLGPMEEVRTLSIVRCQTHLDQDPRTGHTRPYLVLGQGNSYWLWEQWWW
jgi:hypothetical protein